MNWSPRARGGSRGFFGWLETEMVGCLFCKETNQPRTTQDDGAPDFITNGRIESMKDISKLWNIRNQRSKVKVQRSNLLSKTSRAHAICCAEPHGETAVNWSVYR
jgi:hypothetical protein